MKQRLNQIQPDESDENKLSSKTFLLNKHVTIHWKDGADWHWFKVIGYSYGFIGLDHAESPDGNPGDGIIWVNPGTIDYMELGTVEVND